VPIEELLSFSWREFSAFEYRPTSSKNQARRPARRREIYASIAQPNAAVIFALPIDPPDTAQGL
jgi:hypothetical protein